MKPSVLQNLLPPVIKHGVQLFFNCAPILLQQLKIYLQLLVRETICFYQRFCVNLGAIKVLNQFVIQSVSEESREHKVNVAEILPPFGRLNDIEKGFSLKIAMAITPKLRQNLINYEKQPSQVSPMCNLLVDNVPV